MANIEKFDSFSADILAYLYESFPVPVFVNPSVCGLCEVNVISQDPVTGSMITEGEKDPDEDFFHHTIDYLVDSGFINKKHGFQPSRFRYVLSIKGMQVLKHVQKPDIESATLGDKLVSSVKSSAKESAKQALNLAFSLAGTYITSTWMK